MKPQSYEWFNRLAQTQGGYFYPWKQTLEAPSGELLFDALLENLLRPEMAVLEAGCGHGSDALRFGPKVKSWMGFDFVEAFLAIARDRALEQSNLEFFYWNSGKNPPHPRLQNSFDLIVSRRGPTSVIAHLKSLGKSGSKVLCIHPGDADSIAKVRQRLSDAHIKPSAHWRAEVKGWLPTLEDWLQYASFQGDARNLEQLEQAWRTQSEEKGFPITEKRFIWTATIP